MEMIYVRWTDSALFSGWTEAPTKDTGTSEIETIGYLIHEDKKHIEVAQSKSSTNHKSAIMAIPKCVIIERRKLKRSKKW